LPVASLRRSSHLFVRMEEHDRQTLISVPHNVTTVAHSRHANESIDVPWLAEWRNIDRNPNQRKTASDRTCEARSLGGRKTGHDSRMSRCSRSSPEIAAYHEYGDGEVATGVGVRLCHSEGASHSTGSGLPRPRNSRGTLIWPEPFGIGQEIAKSPSWGISTSTFGMWRARTSLKEPGVRQHLPFVSMQTISPSSASTRVPARFCGFPFDGRFRC
jgi:hypothetical protein